jgi:hypothetical protein
MKTYADSGILIQASNVISVCLLRGSINMLSLSGSQALLCTTQHMLSPHLFGLKSLNMFSTRLGMCLGPKHKKQDLNVFNHLNVFSQVFHSTCLGLCLESKRQN